MLTIVFKNIDSVKKVLHSVKTDTTMFDVVQQL